MKKRTLAILSAVMVLAISSMTVFAEETTTVTNTSATPDEYAAKTSISEGYFGESIFPVSADIYNETSELVYNYLSSRPTEFWVGIDDEPTVPAAAGELVAAASNPAAHVTGTILTVVKIGASREMYGGEEFTHTLHVEGISAGDNIMVLGRHYWDDSSWSVLSYETVAAGNSVSFPNGGLWGGPTFDYPYVAVVKITVSDAAGASAATDTTGESADATDAPAADTTAVDTSATEAPAAETAQTPSPQTGETVPMAAVILAVGLTGAVICGKKVFV